MKDEARWGSAWATTLPAKEGELVEVLRNELPELGGRPAPIALSLSTQQNGPVTGAIQQGTPDNAAPRAVVDWQCGAVRSRLLCDWQGQGTIMASHVVISLLSWRPIITNPSAIKPYNPSLWGGPTPPIYAAGVGLGAIQPSLPLTFTTSAKDVPTTLTLEALPVLARRALVMGYGTTGGMVPLPASSLQLVFAEADGDRLHWVTLDAQALTDGVAVPPTATRWSLIDVDGANAFQACVQFELGI